MVNGEYKDVLLNNKILRDSMNRIQSKKHKIRTYEINQILMIKYLKQWALWSSSWLLELIMRKQLF